MNDYNTPQRHNWVHKMQRKHLLREILINAALIVGFLLILALSAYNGPEIGPQTSAETPSPDLISFHRGCYTLERAQ